MNKIEIAGGRSTITLELNKLINDGKTMDLGFRLPESSCRVVVSVTEEDIDTLLQVISEYKHTQVLERLEKKEIINEE